MSLPFDGITVIITGDVDGFTRASANDAITMLGGKPVGSVSGRTGLVIMGDGAGVSKMAKTRQHNLLVIEGPAFADLVTAVEQGTWDGTPVGERVADYDARTADPAPPEPDPISLVPFAERHLIGQATAYPTVDGRPVRQYRRWCQCGHKWLGTGPDEAFACPVEAGTASLNTTAPWASHVTLPPVRRSTPAPAVTQEPLEEPEPVAPADVGTDPYDFHDPYDDIDPEHPGGDWSTTRPCQNGP